MLTTKKEMLRRGFRLLSELCLFLFTDELSCNTKSKPRVSVSFRSCVFSYLQKRSNKRHQRLRQVSVSFRSCVFSYNLISNCLKKIPLSTSFRLLSELCLFLFTEKILQSQFSTHVSVSFRSCVFSYFFNCFKIY